MSHHADGRQGKIQGLRRRAMRPAAFLTGLLTTAGFAAGFAISAQGAARPHAITTNNMGFTALAPSCIADTRAASAGPACATDNGKTLTPGSSLTIDVPSTVPTGAGAVAISVDVIHPTGAGFASVFPAGESFNASNPTANVNFVPGQTVDNIVTTGLGTDSSTGNEAFTIYDGPATGTGGNFDVQVDLFGYYQTNTGSDYNPITPVRADETRSGAADCGSGGTSSCASAGKTLGSGSNAESVNMQVAGVDGVPSNATAVSINLALTNASGGTSAAPNFVEAFPTGQAQPLVANQNYVAGETLSTQVVVGVGAGGDITIANNAGVADVIVDIDGYYTSTGSALNMLSAPTRLTNANGNLVAGGASTSVTIQGTGATAGVTNLAECYEGASTNCPPTVALSGGNFLTAFPTGAAQPFTANLNYTTGDVSNVLSNGAYATASSSGGVTVANGPATAGHALVFVDEFGYFAPVSQAFSLSASPSSLAANGTNTSTITATDLNPSAVGQTAYIVEQYPTTTGTATATNSCVIGTSGSCSVTSQAVTTSGTETVEGLLDTDFDSDAPTTSGNLDPDNDAEPTATTTITWTSGTAAGVTVEPNKSGDSSSTCAYTTAPAQNCGPQVTEGGNVVTTVAGATYTAYAKVTDTKGNPVSGAAVVFTVYHNTPSVFAAGTCKPADSDFTGCTDSTLSATTDTTGTAHVSWTESATGADFYQAALTGSLSAIMSPYGLVIWGTSPLTLSPDYTSGPVATNANTKSTYTGTSLLTVGGSPNTNCVEISTFEEHWGASPQADVNDSAAKLAGVFFSGVGTGETAYSNDTCSTAISTFSLGATPATGDIYMKPSATNGQFSFSVEGPSGSEVTPVAGTAETDFTDTACTEADEFANWSFATRDNGSGYCGATAVGATTVFGLPSSAFTVSVTPTTNTAAASTGTTTYTESVTLNGSPYEATVDNQSAFTFKQLTTDPATATPGVVEDVTFTDSSNATTYCVEGADTTGADCPAGSTPESNPFTSPGLDTVTVGAYNGGAADTYASVYGPDSSTFNVIVGATSGTGTGPATSFGYVDTDGVGADVFESTEPSGTGGTTTFGSSVPAGLELLVRQPRSASCCGPLSAILADKFSDGTYYNPSDPTGNASKVNAGSKEYMFNATAVVTDQSGNPLSDGTTYAVTWTLTNTGASTTHVYLQEVSLATDSGTCSTGSTSTAGADCGNTNLGTTNEFANPENGNASNDTLPSGTSLAIAGGSSLSFTNYTFDELDDSAHIVVDSPDATSLSISAQLATDPSGTAIKGTNKGSPATATVGWAPQPASSASATGTIVAFAPTSTEASPSEDNGTTTSASTAITTGSAFFSPAMVGATISDSGGCIPASDTIATVTDSTHATLATAASASCASDTFFVPANTTTLANPGLSNASYTIIVHTAVGNEFVQFALSDATSNTYSVGGTTTSLLDFINALRAGSLHTYTMSAYDGAQTNALTT